MTTSSDGPNDDAGESNPDILHEVDSREFVIPCSGDAEYNLDDAVEWIVETALQESDSDGLQAKTELTYQSGEEVSAGGKLVSLPGSMPESTRLPVDTHEEYIEDIVQRDVKAWAYLIVLNNRGLSEMTLSVSLNRVK